MKKSTSSWTEPKRLKIVSKEIQKSPDNLSYAFKQIANKIGVSEGAVIQAWYGKLRNLYPQFSTGSKKTTVVNKKNVRKNVNSKFLHETIMSNHVVEGIRVVTLKRYYAG